MSRAEDWEFYLTEVGEHAAAVFCDLARRPDPGCPIRVRVPIKLRHPRLEDGLATADESAALNVVEDTLIDRLSRAGAHYVGRWTCNGSREFVFYAPSGADLDGPLRAVAERFPEYDPVADVSEDAGWAMFRELLLPGPVEMRWIHDRRVVAEMRDAGDDPEVPRAVDHFASFDEEARRDAFLRDARALGFAGEGTHERIGAHLVRQDAVELDHIHEVVRGLMELAERHGGEYDGWGAPVVRSIG